LSAAKAGWQKHAQPSGAYQINLGLQQDWILTPYTVCSECHTVNAGKTIRKTDPAKRRFTTLRLYSPLESFFPKRLGRPSEVELVR